VEPYFAVLDNPKPFVRLVVTTCKCEQRRKKMRLLRLYAHILFVLSLHCGIILRFPGTLEPLSREHYKI